MNIDSQVFYSTTKTTPNLQKLPASRKRKKWTKNRKKKTRQEEEEKWRYHSLYLCLEDLASDIWFCCCCCCCLSPRSMDAEETQRRKETRKCQERGKTLETKRKLLGLSWKRERVKKQRKETEHPVVDVCVMASFSSGHSRQAGGGANTFKTVADWQSSKENRASSFCSVGHDHGHGHGHGHPIAFQIPIFENDYIFHGWINFTFRQWRICLNCTYSEVWSLYREASRKQRHINMGGARNFVFIREKVKIKGRKKKAGKGNKSGYYSLTTLSSFTFCSPRLKRKKGKKKSQNNG